MSYKLDPAVRFTLVEPVFGPRFYSNSNTGKWLLRISENRCADVWLKIHQATQKGIFPAAMIGNSRIVELHNGRNIICVFCRGIDRVSVTRTMIDLRDLDIDDDMLFKTDEATRRGTALGVGLSEHIWKAEDYRVSPVP